MHGCDGLEMARPGIHPMMHLVRLVLTNGASVVVPMAWQRPYPGLEVTTKFLQIDYFGHDNRTGKLGKTAIGEGRRAKFENKFAGKKETNVDDV